ncbi:MAG: Regulator of RpoS [Phycisphaerae bacterium]|nr:Regulator of RpoS [Phycisphaerae bacterium]
MALILLAEDDVHLRAVMAMWLRKQGHQVLEATHGQEAMEMLQSQAVDLLVTDINMPYLRGTELVAWWRLEKKARQPAVMFSSNDTPPAMVERMQRFGVFWYPKPIPPSRLVQLVQEALASGPVVEDTWSTMTFSEWSAGESAPEERK